MGKLFSAKYVGVCLPPAPPENLSMLPIDIRCIFGSSLTLLFAVEVFSYDPASINFRSGAGSHYGTFSGPVGAFSPVDKAKKGYKSSGRNFTTNPAKKGTGYGYLGVTIGPTPKYTPDPYERAKEIRNVCYRTINNTSGKCSQGSRTKLESP